MKTIISYTSSVDMEVQDSSKFTTASSMPASITTMTSLTPSGGSSMTSTMVSSKITSPAAAAAASSIHSVDRLIEFPLMTEKVKSYQQQQQLTEATTTMSTINHNNNIVVANSSLNFNSSSGPKPTETTVLQLGSSYSAVSSITDKTSYGCVSKAVSLRVKMSLIDYFTHKLLIFFSVTTLLIPFKR